MWVMYQIRKPTKKSLLVLNPTSRSMQGEMTSMSHNKVWSLVDFLDSCIPIGCKWVIKTKHDVKGQVVKPEKILIF